MTLADTIKNGKNNGNMLQRWWLAHCWDAQLKKRIKIADWFD
jgi:hypothetical protein